MKKVLSIVFMLAMLLSLAACGGDTTSPENGVSDSQEELPSSNDAETDVSPTENLTLNEVNYIDSDELPVTWHGEWICVYSEANYFSEEETIFIKDFDNAVLYTDIVGENTHEQNRWFCYDEEAGVIHIFNEQPPFDKEWIRDSFEIKKESDSELVFTRVGTGQEVRFEKVDV